MLKHILFEINKISRVQYLYLQLKNLLLDSSDQKFVFSAAAHTGSGDQIYAIVVSRARYKGYVDPGNWQLTLSGSNGVFKFIDDSSQTLGTKRSFAKNGLVFNVASGSLTGAQGSTVVSATSAVAPNAAKPPPPAPGRRTAVVVVQ